MMIKEKFITHRGGVIPYPVSNIDTDQIVPARYLLRSRNDGYGDTMFADLRSDREGKSNPDFIMNGEPFQQASILITFDNFGCGSSREQAVWALLDGGIKAVIAPSFGDIFYGNSLQNGLLPVRATHRHVETMMGAAQVDPPMEAVIDLEAQKVMYGDTAFAFEIDEHRKQALMKGLSMIDTTMNEINAITAFENSHHSASPWLASPMNPA